LRRHELQHAKGYAAIKQQYDIHIGWVDSWQQKRQCSSGARDELCDFLLNRQTEHNGTDEWNPQVKHQNWNHKDPLWGHNDEANLCGDYGQVEAEGRDGAHPEKLKPFFMRMEEKAHQQQEEDGATNGKGNPVDGIGVHGVAEGRRRGGKWLWCN